MTRHIVTQLSRLLRLQERSLRITVPIDGCGVPESLEIRSMRLNNISIARARHAAVVHEFKGT